jgi:hypothetical protein
MCGAKISGMQIEPRRTSQHVSTLPSERQGDPNCALSTRFVSSSGVKSAKLEPRERIHRIAA